MSRSSRSRAVTGLTPSATRASTGSSAPTAATGRSSRIPRSRSSTSRCPTRCTSTWTLRALEAGKHVLCEKPLSGHASEVEMAFDLAERAGLVLMEAFMFRHHPQTRRLEQLVGEGAVGRVRVIRSQFSLSCMRPATCAWRQALDGGALMDLGCYCVDSARLLAGEPERVTAPAGDRRRRRRRRVRRDDELRGRRARALRRRARGRRARRARDRGRRGRRCSSTTPGTACSPGIELRRGDGVEHIAVEPANPYRLEVENVSDAVRGRAQPLLGRDDAVGQARAIEALYEAAGSGVAVTL